MFALGVTVTENIVARFPPVEDVPRYWFPFRIVEVTGLENVQVPHPL